MDLNKIGNNFTIKKLGDCSLEDSKGTLSQTTNRSYDPTPANPNFWQANRGVNISFKGKPESNNEFDTKEKRLEFLKKFETENSTLSNLADKIAQSKEYFDLFYSLINFKNDDSSLVFNKDEYSDLADMIVNLFEIDFEKEYSAKNKPIKIDDDFYKLFKNLLDLKSENGEKTISNLYAVAFASIINTYKNDGETVDDCMETIKQTLKTISNYPQVDYGSTIEILLYKIVKPDFNIEKNIPTIADFLSKKYGDQNAFYMRDIFKILNFTAEQKAKFDTLISIIKTNENGEQVPLFNGYLATKLATSDAKIEDVKTLASMTKTNKNGEQVQLFDGYEIAELIKLKAKIEDIKTLANMTRMNGNGKQVPLFDGCHISTLIKSNANIEDVRTLANIMLILENGDQIPLFNNYDISRLIESKVSIEDIKTLTGITVNKGNKQVSLFNNYNIFSLIESKAKIEDVKTLAGTTRADKNGEQIPLFTHSNICELIRLNINIEDIKAFAKLTKTNKNGWTVPLFNYSEMLCLIKSNAKIEDVIAFASITRMENDEQVPLFDYYTIKDLVESKAKIEDVKTLADMTRADKNSEQSLFDNSDICQLIRSNAKNEDIEAFAKMTKIDENGEQVPLLRGSSISKLIQLKAKIEDVKALADITRTNKNGKQIQFFRDSQIVELIELKAKIEYVKALANITAILDNKDFKPFDGRETVSLIREGVDIDKIKTLLDKKTTNSYGKESLLFNYDQILKISKSNINIEEIDKYISQVETQKAKAIEHPELYINGNFDEEASKQEVSSFFTKNYAQLIILSTIFDKETLNDFLRMRFDNAEEYLNKISHFNPNDLKLLSDIYASYNIDGKPMMPTIKIDFIDLIKAYKDTGLSTAKIQEMIKSGRVDIGELNKNLFQELLKQCGFSDEEISNIPIEKLTGWDKNYIHKLANEITSTTKQVFIDLLKSGNSEMDFKDYIHDTSNNYGRTNEITKKMYEESGLNYDAWVNPPKDCEMQFLSMDKNQEQLYQISNKIKEDIETLRKTPAKGFIDKQFKQCIKGDEFVVPNEYIVSKAKLKEFIENILKQLDSVFKRAEGNINNPAKSENAQNTLMIKNHLNQRLEDIRKIPDTKTKKTIDLKIKMWDRCPQKDIFQGNYSTCCIGMGEINSKAMPHYLLDTTYNMIELVDNNSGETIGNALCYFVKDKSGKPAFIIDNIEIKNSKIPSDETGIKLRTAMAEYARRISKEVTGRDDINIYMSSNYNDVPYKDLPTNEETVSLLGDTDCNEIYMDLYNGWTDKHNYTKNVELLKLA